ncbi:DUF998 domain-containing protein [Mycobacterium sp. Aquia_216]|uniref:DUF998 domain-containing protein n=1 Tax=Mycobacterium sp. Aquia_216 TaxID=2991729 RepID=UPI00227BFC36|nr:DUF998 domain-containing protein [Mycobacterium sp. Aquia_216]WAJ45383.1 DUF998 domain-containing protein [Mycobacterium sp. Aquia_216]
MATRCGAVLWVVAALGYLALEAITAAGFGSAYSYTRNYISDLGVDADSPQSYLIHIAFYLQGALFFLGAVFIVRIPDSPRAQIFLGLIATNAIGNLVIGTVHSGDAHRAGAALAIVGGTTAILAGAAVIPTVGDRRCYRHISELLAAVGLLSLLMLLVNSVTSNDNLLPSGAWERGSVYSIIVWQLLTGVCVISCAAAPSDARRRPRSRR